jgi:hypothetical protein
LHPIGKKEPPAEAGGSLGKQTHQRLALQLLEICLKEVTFKVGCAFVPLEPADVAAPPELALDGVVVPVISTL